MSELKIFTKDLYDDLKENISSNREKYLNSEPFVFDEYGLNPGDYIPKIKLKMPDQYDNYEKENSVLLYNSLKDLDMSIAIDKIFWTTLSHTYYYDYIQHRMPTSKKEAREPVGEYRNRLENFIERHYFQSGDQRKTRHTLSGLWWRAHVTYDESLDNPYEYTEKLYSFSDRDLMNSVVENTNFIKYPNLTKAFIDVINEIDYDQIQGNKRDFNRDIAALINLEGSTRLFNMFSYDDFVKIVREVVEAIQDVKVFQRV